jgi:ankyrin repeat protein
MSKSPLGRRLIAAVHSGSLESAKEMLRLGADPNFVAGFHSPLTMAASEDLPEICQALIGAGARVDMPVQGVTPLHWASGLGSKTVEVLLAAGADGSARIAETGSTPAHIAAEGANAHALAVLAKSGAAMDARDADGQAPIHIAARARDPVALAALIAAGARLNARDAEGRAPLHLASVEAARLLVAAGADTSAIDERGYTAAERQTPAARKAIIDTSRQAQLDGALSTTPRQTKGSALGS